VSSACGPPPPSAPHWPRSPSTTAPSPASLPQTCAATRPRSSPWSAATSNRRSAAATTGTAWPDLEADRDRALKDATEAKEQARQSTVAALNLRAQTPSATQGTLGAIRRAKTWGDVWVSLGLYYGMTPKEAGLEARARRTAAERAADQRAEKAQEKAERLTAELEEARAAEQRAGLSARAGQAAHEDQAARLIVCTPADAAPGHPVNALLAALTDNRPLLPQEAVDLTRAYYEAIHSACCPRIHLQRCADHTAGAALSSLLKARQRQWVAAVGGGLLMT